MAKVERVSAVTKALQGALKTYLGAGKAKPSVIVGYTQNYAVPVHENLEVFHPVGQAKYLSQPARQMQKELGQIVEKIVKQRKTIGMGLIAAGLRLQRASQELVPVDTGALKNSAFTRLEE